MRRIAKVRALVVLSTTSAWNSRRSDSTTVISSAPVDDMVVGDHQAVDVDDHAGAERRFLMLRSRRHQVAEVVAEEALEEGIVGRAGGSCRWLHHALGIDVDHGRRACALDHRARRRARSRLPGIPVTFGLLLGRRISLPTQDAQSARQSSLGAGAGIGGTIKITGFFFEAIACLPFKAYAMILRLRRPSSNKRANVSTRDGLRSTALRHVSTNAALILYSSSSSSSSAGRAGILALGIGVAVDQLDDGHRRHVAIAEAGLEHAGVAAGAVLA